MSTPASAVTREEVLGGGGAPAGLPGRYARFGAFQADLERGELFQNGQRVKVQSKVFQGLQLLLGRAGEIVTREEVRRELWPDTFLANLDANVNTTMNKLRQVLGDSPESPVYVETIPRRGYSFIAEVEYTSALDRLEEAAGNKASEEGLLTAEPANFWSKARVQMLVRAASLLFAGMVLGALLAFVWFFAQSKNQGAGNRARVSVAMTASELQIQGS